MFSISGRVTDNNGASLSSTQLRLTGGQTATTMTDGNGNYSFNNLPSQANYSVSVSRINYDFVPPSRSYTDLAANQANQDFTGTKTRYTIAGALLATINGVTFPLTGVDVTLSGSSAGTTTGNSVYFFNNLNNGMYLVTPSKDGFAFTPPTANVNISNGDQVITFTATPAAAPLEGRIVFISSNIGSINIGSINANGTAYRPLLRNGANDPISARNATSVSLSRDGQTIHYTSPLVIWSVAADGAGTVIPFLVFSGGDSMFTSAAWSPDETKVAFTRSGSPGLWVYSNSGGTTQVPIGTLTQTAGSPTWLSDTRLVFSASDGNDKEIYAVNTNGTGLLQLTNNSVQENWPSASADGAKIAFLRTGSTFTIPNTLFVMNSDGSGATQISDKSLGGASWSPDGTKVAFVERTSADRVVAFNAGGGGRRVIYNGVLSRFFWGPEYEFPTPTGSNVLVDTGGVDHGGASVTFASVATAGTTTFTTISPSSAGSAPSGFVIANQAYEISTTAAYAAPVTVCFKNLYGFTQTAFNALSLMHMEGGVLVDKTTSRDFSLRRICGTVTTLSPFVLAQQTGGGGASPKTSLPSITGLVVDNNGNPLGDVAMQLTGTETQTTQTDAFGIFNFVNLTQDGNYNVQPKLPGYLFSEYSQDFITLTGENTVVFTGIQSNFSIGGKAVDQNGAPVSGVEISLDGAFSSFATTDSNGDYSFAGLAADSAFTVTAFKSGLEFTPAQHIIDPLTGDASDVNFTTASSACTWDGSTGDWNDASHWVCSHVPTTGDAAIVSSGNPIISADVAIDNLQFSGGTITCNANLTVAGSMIWNGGTINGIGAGSIINNGVLSIGGASAKTLDNRSLINNAAINWTGGPISLANGAVVSNQASATFNIETDASITGAGSFVNNGALTKNAGVGMTTMGVPFTNGGYLNVAAGALSFTSSFTQTGGSTAVAGGALSFNQTASYQGGTLGGAGTISGSINNTGATVAPGSSPGVLTIDGNYAQGDLGALNIELGGLTIGTQYDRLAITGTATLGGTLNVALTNGFFPTNGNSFSVMTFTSRSGNFSIRNGLNLSSGLRLDPVFTPTAFNLTVTDQPTLITLSKFEAMGYDNGALLEWRTGLEVNNLGFRIYRQEGGTRLLLNQDLVAGSALVAGSETMLTAGRTYAYWVDAKDAGKESAFWLEDIDLNGTSTWHGPVFAKQVGGKPPVRSLAESLSQVGRASGAARRRWTEPAAAPPPA